MKKLVSIVLTLACLLSVFCSVECVSVSAQTDDYANVEALFTSAWDNFETTVNIYECDIDVSEFDTMCDTIIDRRPEYFYVDIVDCRCKEDGQIVYVNFSYKWSEEETKQKIEAFNQESDKILALIPQNITTEEKILFLHDYIAKHVSYDLRVFYGVDTTDDQYIRTAYGCLVNGIAVCEGISNAFLHLCNKLGIECYLVKSTAMYHEWNMVKLGNNYYHIDITQDSPVYNLGTGKFHQPLGEITHTFFLKSDDQIKNSALGNNVHYSWAALYKASDSITYKNAFWDGSESAVNYIDGKYYYMCNGLYCSDEHCDGTLVEYDYKNLTKNKIFTSPKDIWNGSNSKNYLWESKESRAVADFENNLIFFHAANEIYCYNINNGSISMVYSRNATGFIYSIIYEDNYLYATIRNYNKKGTPVYADFKLSTAVIPDSQLLMGDVNADNNVNVSDLLAVKKYLANHESDNISLDCADIKCDNVVDVKDTFVLKKILLYKH